MESNDVGRPSPFTHMLRTGQIIVGALVAGLLFFLVIVVVFLETTIQPMDPRAIVSIVMAGFALLAVPTRILMPGIIVSSARKNIAQGKWKAISSPQQYGALPDTDEGKLLGVYMSKVIVGSAILEGAAFANILAYMMEGQVYSIVLGVLFMIAILAGMPTRRGLEEWLETQLRRVKEIRDMGRG